MDFCYSNRWHPTAQEMSGVGNWRWRLCSHRSVLPMHCMFSLKSRDLLHHVSSRKTRSERISYDYQSQNHLSAQISTRWVSCHLRHHHHHHFYHHPHHHHHSGDAVAMFFILCMCCSVSGVAETRLVEALQLCCLLLTDSQRERLRIFLEFVRRVVANADVEMEGDGCKCLYVSLP